MFHRPELRNIVLYRNIILRVVSSKYKCRHWLLYANYFGLTCVLRLTSGIFRFIPLRRTADECTSK